MFHLVYSSIAVGSPSDEELIGLLEQSRERNARDGITGLLVFFKGGYFQVLEGPEAKVRLLFSRIQKDYRHHDVVVLMQGTIEAREFADWHMAFRSISPVEVLPAGFSSLLQQNWDAHEFTGRAGICQDILLHLRNGLR